MYYDHLFHVQWSGMIQSLHALVTAIFCIMHICIYVMVSLPRRLALSPNQTHIIFKMVNGFQRSYMYMEIAALNVRGNGAPDSQILVPQRT